MKDNKKQRYAKLCIREMFANLLTEKSRFVYYALSLRFTLLVAEDQWMNVYNNMMFIEKMTRERNDTIKAENETRLDREWQEKLDRQLAKAAAARKKEEDAWRNRWNW